MLTSAQTELVGLPLDAKIFLSGPAGCGKTTVGVERMHFLLEQGVPADSLLVLTPQRTLQAPYQAVLRSPGFAAGGEVTLATVGGLARRMVELFWPLAAEAAGFAHPDQPPVFLTLETSQYYMAHLVRPLLDQGYFESVTIDRNRLYSQIIDNLNKAASVGFDYRQIGERLEAAWVGDPGQRRVYADAQACATLFREYCLAHNLLDFSLQLDTFWNVLWHGSTARDFLKRSYRHLIYDNLEEDVPRAHDLVAEWLPDFESALLVYDEGGGYRKFLGADPQSAWALSELCSEQATLAESFVVSPGIDYLSHALAHAIDPTRASGADGRESLDEALTYSDARFYPQMLDGIIAEIAQLVADGLPPSEIVVLAPFLSDALRFSLTDRLEARGLPWRSHRPSRSLRDEPATQGLLTLAALAHPGWEIHPSRYDVTRAILLAFEGMDLVRAQLLAEIVYHQKDLTLSEFERIKSDVQERITFVQGEHYTRLRGWLLAYRESEAQPLDHFLRRLFGEVLSQPGFGFHRNFDAARVAASLIESIQKFRWAMEPTLAGTDGFDLGREYIAMLQEGLIAAQYLQAWRTEENQAVLVAPAYTFLMMNRPATVQFWLDPGAGGWAERLFQPLTQPYVLSRHWEPGRQWSDADEVATAQETLARLVSGLLRRCRERVYLGLSELGESGFEQRGVMLKAFQKVLSERQDGP
jgi:hypothetical protein